MKDSERLEEQTETVCMDNISKWLSNHHFIPYWDKNYRGFEHHNTFETRGKRKQRRSDILVVPQTELDSCTLLEVKVPKLYKIRDGYDQIIGYWSDYVNDDTEYYIGEEKKSIEKFLIATDYSMKGKLIDEKIVKHPSEERQKRIDEGQLPQTEFIQTYDTVRNLWTMWGEKIKNIDTKIKKAEIGILLSSLNDNNTTEPPIPKTLTQYFHHYENHIQRIQRWELL